MKLPAPDPFARVDIWASPGFRAEEWPDYPLYAFDYEDLRDHCAAALATRRETYPALVTRGVVTEREAAADIRGWEFLLAEWGWICTAAGTLPPAGTLADRRGAVELALERIKQRFDRGGRQHDLYRQAHLNTALRWHLHCLHGGAPAVHRLAALSREMQAEAAAREVAVEGIQT